MGHVNIGFLSPCPVVERLIKVWPALQRYFDKPRLCTKALETTCHLEEDETLGYSHFVHNVISAMLS